MDGNGNGIRTVEITRGSTGSSASPFLEPRRRPARDHGGNASSRSSEARARSSAGVGRSDPFQLVGHLLVLAGGRIHAGLDLSVGRPRSHGRRPRLRSHGEDPDALLPSRRQGVEAMTNPGPSGKRMRGGDAVLARPEEDVLVPGAGGDPSSGGEAAPDPAPAPISTPLHTTLSRTTAREPMAPAPITLREISSPSHGRRERTRPAPSKLPPASGNGPPRSRASSDARRKSLGRPRSANGPSCGRNPMESVAKERFPQVRDEASLARRDAAEECRRQDAHAGVEKRAVRLRLRSP